MRTKLCFTIIATVAMTLACGDAWGRPGRGGAGPRSGGAQGGNRPNVGGPTKSKQAVKPNRKPDRKSDSGQAGIKKNAGGNVNSNLKGQFDNRKSSDQRPNNQQLRDFLGQKSGTLKPGDVQRTDKAPLNKEQFQAQAGQIQSNVQGRADDLFTPQWYAQHPNAWQATHPHADAWAVATAASVAAWVGTAAYGGGSDTIIVESDGTVETTEEATDSGDATSTEPQDFTSTNEANDPSQWLALGVFALAQNDQTEPTTLIQLSVNKQGQINGSYYDLVSDNGTPVGGQLDVDKQKAAWTVGETSKNVFATSVDTLTGDSGPVTLHLSNGDTQDWNLIRLKQPEPAAPNAR